MPKRYKGPPKNPGGKPGTGGLDPAKYLPALVEALAKGMPKSAACEYAGVGISTVSRWLELADSGDLRYVEFAHEFRSAHARGKGRLWDKVDRSRDWRAHMALLRAADPDTYNENSGLRVAVTTQNPLLGLPSHVLEAELVRDVPALVAGADDVHGTLPSGESGQHVTDPPNAGPVPGDASSGPMGPLQPGKTGH